MIKIREDRKFVQDVSGLSFMKIEERGEKIVLYLTDYYLPKIRVYYL